MYKTGLLLSETVTKGIQMRDNVDQILELKECPYAEEDDWVDLCYGGLFFGQVEVEPIDEVVVFRPTNEKKANVDSWIVLEREAAPSKRHTLYRYMVNSTDFITYEKLFETSSFANIQEIYLLDDFAIAQVDDNELISIFYKDFLGEEVP